VSEGALLGGTILRFKGAAIASVTLAIDRALAWSFVFLCLAKNVKQQRQRNKSQSFEKFSYYGNLHIFDTINLAIPIIIC